MTAACMLVRRDVFLNVGGYEEALGIAFNDVDFCLRLSEAGWRIVWTPSAELYHRESVSIGRHDVGEREEEWRLAWNLMRSRWSEQLTSDSHYSSNLSLDPLQLWEPSFPPTRRVPVESRLARGWRRGAEDDVRGRSAMIQRGILCCPRPASGALPSQVRRVINPRRVAPTSLVTIVLPTCVRGPESLRRSPG